MTAQELSLALGPRVRDRLNREPNQNEMLAGGVLLDELRKLLSEISLPPKNDVLEALGRVYDELVAPLDIPAIPDRLEPWLDGVLRSGAMLLAGRIYDRLSQE